MVVGDKYIAIDKAIMFVLVKSTLVMNPFRVSNIEDGLSVSEIHV